MTHQEQPLYPIGYLVAGRYELVRPLGAGAMGSVHQAIDRRLDKLVAVKILNPQFSRSPNVIMRFQREAKATAKLRQENICDVTDFGQTKEGLSFLVMELLEGETLSERLKRQQKLPTAEALEITFQILSGLEVAHTQGVVHRDLKPGNIVLTRFGDGRVWVKLIDFGIAKLLDDKDSLEGTVTGTVIGTSYYMSPEQASGDVRQIDQRSDLWSVGIILYYLLTGQVPFKGENHQQINHSIFNHDPIPPGRLEPSISLALDTVILKTLSKDRNGRYASAAELSQALRATNQTGAQDTLAEHRQPEVAVEPRPGHLIPPTLEEGLAASLTPTELPAHVRRPAWMLPTFTSLLFLLILGVGAILWLIRDQPAPVDRTPATTQAATTEPETPVAMPEPPAPSPEPLRAEVATVVAELVGLPEGAQVRFDGAEVQGNRIQGPAGTEGVLEVDAEGYEPLREQLILSDGTRFDLASRLRRAAQEPSRRRIPSEPVRVSTGQPRQETPPSPPEHQGQPTPRQPGTKIVGDW
jgi:serine/threonine-protein kinase